MYRSILKKVSAVQVLQTSFVENVRAYYDGPITVIGNVVAPADCKKEERLKRIICLSRVEPDKRQLAATEAFAKLRQIFPIGLWTFSATSRIRDICANACRWRNNIMRKIKFVFMELQRMFRESFKKPPYVCFLQNMKVSVWGWRKLWLREYRLSVFPVRRG